MARVSEPSRSVSAAEIVKGMATSSRPRTVSPTSNVGVDAVVSRAGPPDDPCPCCSPLDWSNLFEGLPSRPPKGRPDPFARSNLFTPSLPNAPDGPPPIPSLPNSSLVKRSPSAKFVTLFCVLESPAAVSMSDSASAIFVPTPYSSRNSGASISTPSRSSMEIRNPSVTAGTKSLITMVSWPSVTTTRSSPKTEMNCAVSGSNDIPNTPFVTTLGA